MWPHLVSITRSNEGWKLLQTVMKKPFFIGRHALFTDALSSYVVMSSKSGDISVPKVLGLKTYVSVQSVLHSLCLYVPALRHVGRRNLIF